MTEAAKRNMRNVIVFALIDGKLQDDELQFIDSLRERLGISRADFRQICDDARQNSKMFSLPSDPAEATETIHLLVETAMADGAIHSTEQRMLQKLCKHVGLGEQELDDIIKPLRDARDSATSKIEAMIEQVYGDFQSWDNSTRKAKLEAISAGGSSAVIPLLRMFESYRVPDGAKTGLEIRAMVAEQLGRIGDRRAAYYLAQQINIGDVEDDISSYALRCVSAEAMGKCVGESFTPDQAGIDAERKWWSSSAGAKYNFLAF